MLEKPEINIVLPVLNEEKSIGQCLKNLMDIIKNKKLRAEVIIVNNGSSDKTFEIIMAMKKQLKNTRIIDYNVKGYGSAYLKGFEAVSGKYIFMVDADGSYDFNEMPKFIDELRKGYDFIIGDRFKGKIDRGAMPWSNRYIGNPLLSSILRIFFGAKVHDVHCGMRAISREALERLNLKTTGMEFASEMVIKAVKKLLKIKEIPINYHKRKGDSKLRPISDGWRHLRFMLLYAPLFLFFIPGLILFLAGMISMEIFYFIQIKLLMIVFYYHPMFISSILVIVGYQLMIFAFFAKTYAINHLGEPPTFDKVYKYLTLERASIIGIIIILLGLAIFVKIFLDWWTKNFDALSATKDSIVAMTLLMVGIQSIFSSFMLSILGIREK